MAKVSRPLSTERVELADEPAYGDVTWVSPLRRRPVHVPDPDKVALLADWSAGLLAHDSVAHVDASLHSRAREQVLRRPRRHDDDPAAGAHPVLSWRPSASTRSPAASTPCARSRRRSAAAGSTSPATGWDWAAELDELPELLAEKLRGPVGRGRRLRPGDRPVQPVADHPRVDRARHRAGPGAGLRGQLRRHLVRDLRQARARCAYGSAGDERHRRPHRRARPGHDRLRRRGRRRRSVGHRQGRRAGRLPARPARWPGSRASAGPTAARSPTPPAHVPMQRMANVSLQPAAGRPVDRGADRPGRARHLRRRRQELVDRHAALQLPVHRAAVLPIENGRLAGQLRDVAYQATTTDFWGSLEAVGGPQTYVLGGAFNCGKGQPGQVARGQPRLPVGAVPRRADPQHRRRRQADEHHDRHRREAAGGRRAGAGAVHRATAAS